MVADLISLLAILYLHHRGKLSSTAQVAHWQEAGSALPVSYSWVAYAHLQSQFHGVGPNPSSAAAWDWVSFPALTPSGLAYPCIHHQVHLHLVLPQQDAGSVPLS